MHRIRKWLWVGLTSIGVSACGLYTPDFQIARPGTDELTSFVTAVAGHIGCELQNAVIDVTHRNARITEELKKWSAELTLTLTVDEKSGLAPSVSYAEKIFSFGAGANGSAEATRVLELTWFLFFEKFLESGRTKQPCNPGPLPISGNLKIGQSLHTGIYSLGPPDNTDETAKFGLVKVIKHHVTFEIEGSLNATPAWKFVEVAVNPSNPLITASRKRTDDLLITMGRSEQQPVRGQGREHQLSRAVRDSHFAGQIANSLRSTLRQ